MEMREEIEKHLNERIIPFWEKLADRENGGFYGYMGYDLVVDRKAVKGCILNSRITWFLRLLNFFLMRATDTNS